jgi:uncharacterized membrane protein YhiD involved in acid resistance
MMEVGANEIEMIVRLLAALVAGTFIGYERSFHGRPAGLRTHVLVCLASSCSCWSLCMRTTGCAPRACRASTPRAWPRAS